VKVQVRQIGTLKQWEEFLNACRRSVDLCHNYALEYLEFARSLNVQDEVTIFHWFLYCSLCRGVAIRQALNSLFKLKKCYYFNFLKALEDAAVRSFFNRLRNVVIEVHSF